MDDTVAIPIPADVTESVVTATDIVIELAIASGFLVLIFGINCFIMLILSRNFSTRFVLRGSRAKVRYTACSRVGHLERAHSRTTNGDTTR